MCILCVVQKWSRRVATMLPWLVIPLIILWALSQLLPPGLRFEVTSPRLACVLVLLATLFWYEILMPRLSSWRARRTARLRERCRTEALELQKLRKTATRRCRNCQMPYRDQNPGGGRFMCSYCGHISKRPALDLPGQRESTGIIADLVRKNGWLCDADGNGNWVGPVPKYLIGSDYRCSTERSYSGAFFVSSKLLSCFFLSVRWLCGKVFRFGSSQEDGSCDSDHRRLSRKGEIDGNFQESRGEKARRKAEEKRQARLEKEMLEEEERKQREEVARLVEERRKLRDEIVAAEIECSRVDGDRDVRKEMDRKKRDRRKDKDKASSKSNSDGEELEKRASRENERKWEFDKKGENERQDLQKSVGDNYKSHSLDGVYGSKVAVNKARYFDRMKGTFLSSSRGFGSAAFFGRNMQNSAAVIKSAKPASGFTDYSQNSGNRRDTHPLVHAASKSNSNVGDKASEINTSRPAGTDVLPKTGVFNKPWHELFTGSSEVSPSPDANSANHVDQTGHLSSRSDQTTHQNFLPSHSTNYLANFGHSLPFVTYPSTTISVNSNPNFNVVPETAFPPLKKQPKSSVSEDAESFEDPCYVPDPISLLGPVSESLDNFSLDLETEFTSRSMSEGSPHLKSVSTSADVNRPSPIEPRLSKLHFPEGLHTPSDQLFCTPRSDVSGTMDKQSTWQMWGSSSDPEAPGLIGRPSSWFSTLVQNNSQQQDFLHSSSHKPIVPPISRSKNTPQGVSGQSIHTGNHDQHGGTYSPLDPSLNDNGIWLQSSPFQSILPFDGDNHLLPLNLMDTFTQNEATNSGPNKSTAMHPFEAHQASSWSKDKHVLRGPRESGNLNPGSANVESFFSRGPDAPSVWSCNE